MKTATSKAGAPDPLFICSLSKLVSETEMKMINDQALVHGEAWTGKEDHIRLPRPERHLSSARSRSQLSLKLKANDDEYAGGQTVVLNRFAQRETEFCL